MSKAFDHGYEVALTTREAAKMLSVSLRTVQLWCEENRLPHRRTQGGHRRIPLFAVKEMLKDTLVAPTQHSQEYHESFVSEVRMLTELPGSYAIPVSIARSVDPATQLTNLTVNLWIPTKELRERFLERIRSQETSAWGSSILRVFGIIFRRVIERENSCADVSMSDWNPAARAFPRGLDLSDEMKHTVILTVKESDKFPVTDFVETFMFA